MGLNGFYLLIKNLNVMKVEVKEKDSEVKYPCLMISDDKKLIVLFSKRKCGICIYSTDSISNNIGTNSEEWVMELFELFDGEITLKND